MSDNRKVTLEFDRGDLPMLASSLRTTIAEAMMSNRPRAKERAERIRASIEALIPPPAKIFDGITWSEICIALDGAATFSVGFEHWGYQWNKESGSREKGRIYVAVGGRAWGTRGTDNPRDGGLIEQVRDLVAEMAPLDCVHVPVADTKARHLMPHDPPAPSEETAPRYRGDEDYDDYGDLGERRSYNP